MNELSRNILKTSEPKGNGVDGIVKHPASEGTATIVNSFTKAMDFH